MAWFDKLRKGFEEVVSHVSDVQAEVLALQYYRAGRKAVEEGFRTRPATEAVADLRQATTAESNFLPDAKRWLARAYEAVGNLEAARHCYEEALALLEQDDTGRLAAWIAEEYDMDPDDYRSDLHDELATYYARQGHHEQAAEQARRAAKTNRDNLNAYHTLIVSLHALGRTEELHQWLFRARERDSLGLVDQWVADLGLGEEEPGSGAPAPPPSQFDGIELPGLESEQDDG